MHTIAIVNEKGGTGKTSTTVNLAAALGELGKKVLLVDLDGQAAASRWLNVEGDPRFADALWAGGGLEPIPEVLPNVALAPGHGKLDVVAHDLRPTQGGQLKKVLSELSGFEYVLIDCPPSLGNRLIGNALLACDAALVPVETSVLPLDGLKILLTTLDDVRNGFGHHIRLAGVVGVRYDARTRLSRLVMEELHRALPGRVFQTTVRESVRMRECPAAGDSILGYAPDSTGAEDYRQLAREVLVRMETGIDTGEQLITQYDRDNGDRDHWKEIGARLMEPRRRGSDGEDGEAAPASPPAMQTPATQDAPVSPPPAPAPPLADPVASTEPPVRDEQPTQEPETDELSEEDVQRAFREFLESVGDARVRVIASPSSPMIPEVIAPEPREALPPAPTIEPAPKGPAQTPATPAPVAAAPAWSPAPVPATPAPMRITPAPVPVTPPPPAAPAAAATLTTWPPADVPQPQEELAVWPPREEEDDPQPVAAAGEGTWRRLLRKVSPGK